MLLSTTVAMHAWTLVNDQSVPINDKKVAAARIIPVDYILES